MIISSMAIRLLPYLKYCEKCCGEHGVSMPLEDSNFSSFVISTQSGTAGHGSFIFNFEGWKGMNSEDAEGASERTSSPVGYGE